MASPTKEDIRAIERAFSTERESARDLRDRLRAGETPPNPMWVPVSMMFVASDSVWGRWDMEQIALGIVAWILDRDWRDESSRDDMRITSTITDPDNHLKWYCVEYDGAAAVVRLDLPAGVIR